MYMVVMTPWATLVITNRSQIGLRQQSMVSRMSVATTHVTEKVAHVISTGEVVVKHRPQFLNMK